MATNLAFAKNEIRYPFIRFALHAADHPPSGINAANGFWVEETRKDPEVKSKIALTPPDEIINLLEIFWLFLDGVALAFERPNVEADLTTKPALALPALEAYAEDILAVFVDIWNIYKGSVDEGTKAKDRLVADIKKVIEDVQKDGNLTQGSHANGFIAKEVAAAATAAVSALDAQFPKGTDTDAGRLADALRVVFVKLLTLSTDGNDPWLVASWQISFQFINGAAAKAMA